MKQQKNKRKGFIFKSYQAPDQSPFEKLFEIFKELITYTSGDFDELFTETLLSLLACLSGSLFCSSSVISTSLLFVLDRDLDRDCHTIGIIFATSFIFLFALKKFPFCSK